MRRIVVVLQVVMLQVAVVALAVGGVALNPATASAAATPAVHEAAAAGSGTAPTVAEQIQQAQARFATQIRLPHPGTPETLTHPTQDGTGSTNSARLQAGSAAAHGKAGQSAGVTLAGLDVSGYQGNVNWPQVAAGGAAFAYTKATEGTTYTSPSFPQQYNGSYNAGLIRGAYHFAIPNASTGAAQADFFVATGGGWSADRRTLPGMLDIEYNPYGPSSCYGLTPAQMVSWLASFDAEYHLLTQRWPDIYTTTDWWQTCTGNSGAFSQESLSIASYSAAIPVLPNGWTAHTFWQWADSGTFPGDQERFNGDRQALVAFAAGQTAGAFTALNPTRILDTRTGNGAAQSAVGPWQTVTLQVDGVHGVPAAGVSAVTVNVTATAPTAAGFVTVYPDGSTRPMASSLNFVAALTVANLAVVPVGADGSITLYNGSPGTVQLIADLAGYYLAGIPTAPGTFGILGPVRVLDTRFGTGAPAAAVRPWQKVSVQVAGVNGVPSSGVSAVVVNLTATGGAANGYLTAYPDGIGLPVVSNLNFSRAQTVADLVVVPVGADGRVNFFNGSFGTVQLIADLAGYYRSGQAVTAGALQPVPLKRVLDTRIGLGAPARRLGPNGSISLQVSGQAGVYSSGATALLASVTVVSPTTVGYLAVYPSGTTPTTSNIDFAAKRTVANLVVVPLGTGGRIQVTNKGGGTVDVLVDFVGFYVDGTVRTAYNQPCNTVPPDPAGTSITRWNPITLCVLASLGQSSGNLSDVNTVIVNESGGDPNAINLYDINAQEGHPSEGLIQVIRPTFDLYRSTLLPNNLYDPAANLYAGLNYAISTYGSIHNIPGLVSLRNGGGYQGYIRHR